MRKLLGVLVVAAAGVVVVRVARSMNALRDRWDVVESLPVPNSAAGPRPAA
jgi:hypothetical protein